MNVRRLSVEKRTQRYILIVILIQLLLVFLVYSLAIFPYLFTDDDTFSISQFEFLLKNAKNEIDKSILQNAYVKTGDVYTKLPHEHTKVAQKILLLLKKENQLYMSKTVQFYLLSVSFVFILFFPIRYKILKAKKRITYYNIKPYLGLFLISLGFLLLNFDITNKFAIFIIITGFQVFLWALGIKSELFANTDS